MNLLPIVDREVRVATRRRATYWSRVVTAVVAVGLTAWMLQTLGMLAPPHAVGLRLFRLVSGLALFFALFTGVILTADCLSHEKREGTLGLLFLTDLKGYDVTLGKLFGTSIAPFCALLAVFPVLALPLVLGGVTVGEFWRTAAALANGMFFSLAAGLCVSAVMWHAQRAVLGAGLLVVTFAWVFPEFGRPCVYFSPVTVFRAALDANFARRPELFFTSLGLTQVLGWTMVGLASRWAPRYWRQANVRPRRAFFLARPGARVRAGKAAAPGQRDPVDWLANKGMEREWIWCSLALAAIAWAVVSIFGLGPGTLPMACLLGAAILELVLQFWIAWESGRRFGEDRKSGLLECLLVSPVTVEEIVRAQLRSLRRQFRWPVVGVLVFQLCLLIFATSGHRWRPGVFPGFLAIMVTAMIWTVVTAYGLVWVGLWQGLSARKSIDAGLRALSWVVGAPMIAFISVSFLLFLVGPGNLDGPTVAAVLLVALGSVGAHLSVEYARTGLHRRFKLLASGDG